MRLPRLTLVALLSFIAGNGCVAADTRASTASPIVWQLNSTATIAGHPVKVLGSPQLKTDDSGTALYFNGVDDGIFMPVNPLTGAGQFTIEVLIKPDATGATEQRFFHLQDEPGSRALLEIRLADGRWALDTFLYSVESTEKCALLDRSKTHPADEWTWVALVYADGHMAHYIDGQKELAGVVKFPATLAGQVSLGVRQNKVYWFKGGIREVRFHPVALAPAALQHAAR